MGRINKFEKIKWQRSVFNPQKSLWPETSTSTLKLPLSPRPNLMPFPSRETASATKFQLHYLQSCIDQFIWSYCTFILATYSVLRNKNIPHFKKKKKKKKK